MYTLARLPGGGGGSVHSPPLQNFLQDKFCNSSKYEKKFVGGCNTVSKHIKSTRQTKQTFLKSYNNYIIQFPLCFSYSFLLDSETAPTVFSL